jgi:hypothetical protein
MKKALLLISFGLLIFASGCTSQVEEEKVENMVLERVAEVAEKQRPGYVEYENNLEPYFKIEYPSAWKLERIDDFTVRFLAPEDLGEDSFSDHITVKIAPVAEGGFGGSTLLSNYYSAASEILEIDPDMEILVRPNFTTLGGYQAFYVVYRINNIIKPKWLQYFTVWKGNAYSVALGSTEEDYDYFFPIVERMVQSFEIEQIEQQEE